MADFDLNSFLAEQEAAGTSQGEGDFTVSHEKAAQKMAKYSLPREFSWVLKIVQAAVAARCTSIRVVQSRTDSTFFFETDRPQALPTMQELVSAILQLSLDGDRFVDRLGAALRMLVEKSHQSFLLRVARGLGEPQSMYAGVYFGEMSEEARAKQRADWEAPLCLRINHVPHNAENRYLLNWIPVKDQALPLAMELERYAYVCPIPIILDGRRLDGILRTGALGWSPRIRPIRTAGLQIPEDLDPAFSICEGFGNRILSVDGAVTSGDETDEGDSEAYLVLGLTTSRNRYESLERSRRSYVCWVRDGVLVEEERLGFSTHALGTRVYVSAQGLTTDLTGFNLTRNAQFVGRRTRLLERLRSVLELELLSERELFSLPEENKDRQKENATKLESLLKTIRTVADSFSDRSAYWDRLAMEKAYTMDLRTSVDWLERNVNGDSNGRLEFDDDDDDDAQETLEASNDQKAQSSLSPKPVYRWKPPEER